MAQAFHHTILPLASLADRRTELRWGIRADVLQELRDAVAAGELDKRSAGQ